MIRPEALKKNEPLMWSPGLGTEVWEMFCAAITGKIETIKQLLDKDPSLVPCSHAYRTPLYFAVRENQVELGSVPARERRRSVKLGNSRQPKKLADDNWKMIRCTISKAAWRG